MSAPPLAERVLAAGGLPGGGPAVVAFSGGRDSLCLLDLAAGLLGPDGLLAAHVHHGLRGRSADEDAAAATATAAGLGVAVRVLHLRPPAALGPGGPSPVPWARDARRAALRRAADAWGGPGTPVLVAHTASDQAETVLLRAISSPGVRALSGIAPRDAARGVLRPLLAAGVTRAEAGAWCAARGLDWRDDPTNAATPRGRVRALLAGLEAVDPRATGALVRTAALAREDDAALVATAAALLGGRGSIGADALAAAPAGVGRRALRALAEGVTGAPCPRAGGRLEELLALSPGPARLDLGDGARAVVEGGLVRCERTPARG